jgi:hypothetical protein
MVGVVVVDAMVVIAEGCELVVDTELAFQLDDAPLSSVLVEATKQKR